MLAQSFLSHTDLEITEAEHGALIKVLGMLERGELVEVHYDYTNVETKKVPNGFSMAFAGEGPCGTTALRSFLTTGSTNWDEAMANAY